MPLVNGTLTDFGLAPLLGLDPVLLFRATSAGISNQNLLAASMPVEVTPAANGFFEVELAATDALMPGEVEYRLEVKYRERRTRNVKHEVLPWALRVPEAGGAITDLLQVPSNPASVWVGTTPPDNPTSGTWWYNPETGELNEWSN